MEMLGHSGWNASAGNTEYNLAPLRSYLDDPAVFEVRINKYGQVVCDTIDGRVFHDDPRITEDWIHALVSNLCYTNGADFNAVNNLRLPDGSRCIFCLPPAVVEGTVLVAIRKHLEVTKPLEELDKEGRFSDVRHRKIDDQMILEDFEQELLNLLERKDFVSFLRLAVIRKRNIAVAGPTGSGKTTLTRSLLLEVPANERVILLEDVHEVNSSLQDEVGYMLYGDQEGRLSARDCLKSCMRLSPERIFMTELRDDAAWDYLSASNTGHPGGIFSTHADSAASTLTRVATLVKQTADGANLDWNVIMKAVASAIDIVVYMEKRQIKEILYDPLGKRKAMNAF